MATGNARVILPAATVTLDPARVMGGLNEFEKRHAPERLYACGEVSLLHAPARVAVVGSRNASLPGRKRVARLVAALVEREVVIVSGLAAGIDTAAHEETLKRGGRTIAVLEISRGAQQFVRALKEERLIGAPPQSPSEYAARRLAEEHPASLFDVLFAGSKVSAHWIESLRRLDRKSPPTGSKVSADWIGSLRRLDRKSPPTGSKVSADWIESVRRLDRKSPPTGSESVEDWTRNRR